MLVLTIIGTLLGLIVVGIGLMRFNDYTERIYRYEVFSTPLVFGNAFAWALMLGGYYWMDKARRAIAAAEAAGRASTSDPLNGVVIGIIGLTLYLILTVILYRRLGWKIGTVAMMIGWVIYPVAAIGGFIAFVLLIGFLSETKPVYNINGSNKSD